MFEKKIAKEELETFYQSKYEYFRRVSFMAAMITAFAEITYFITDCQIFGRFAWETVVPRFSVLLPVLLLVIIEPRIKSYKVATVLYYMVAHAAMWATIWAIWYLPDRDFAREGFIIMHFAFLAVGFGMPVKYHIPMHGAMLLNIIVSNQWNHYEKFSMMISMSIPIYIGAVILMMIQESSYADHYLVRKELQNSLITDNLTSVYNRNKIEEILFPDSGKLDIPHVDYATVLMMDIDWFKNVNDTYGHDAGDKILVFFAEQIKKCVRSIDIVVRWGGEEFVVLLLGADLDAGYKIAEKIRRTVEVSKNEICPITTSIGVCRYDGGDFHESVKKADKALYYAKNHGRNRVVMYDDIKDGIEK